MTEPFHKMVTDLTTTVNDMRVDFATMQSSINTLTVEFKSGDRNSEASTLLLAKTVEGLQSAVSDLRIVVKDIAADHERRITTLERRMWTALGAIGLVSAVGAGPLFQALQAG